MLLLLLLASPWELCEAWSYSQDVWGHCRCDVGYCSCETDPERAAVVNPPSSPGYSLSARFAYIFAGAAGAGAYAFAVDLQYVAYYSAIVFGFYVGAPLLVLAGACACAGTYRSTARAQALDAPPVRT